MPLQSAAEASGTAPGIAKDTTIAPEPPVPPLVLSPSFDVFGVPAHSSPYATPAPPPPPWPSTPGWPADAPKKLAFPLLPEQI